MQSAKVDVGKHPSSRRPQRDGVFAIASSAGMTGTDATSRGDEPEILIGFWSLR